MKWESSAQRNKNMQQRQAEWINDKKYQQQRSAEVSLYCSSAAYQIHAYLFLLAHWSQTDTQLHVIKVKIADLSDVMLKKEDEHEILMLRKE